MSRNSSCRRCGLSQTATTVCVYGTGPAPAAIMLVGEAPGENEDIEGKPFVGQAGKLLNDALRDAGLRRADVYITNIVKCRPPNNRDPLPTEASACFPYLAQEIAAVKPQIILAMGAQAIKELSGRKESIKSLRGHHLTPAKGIRLGGAQLMGTYHPAAYLHSRNPQILDDLTADLKMVKAMTGGSDLPNHERYLYPPGWSADSLREVLYVAGFEGATANLVAVDCEWTAVQDREIGWPWTPGAELYSVSLAAFVDGEIRSIGLAWPPKDDEAREVLSAYLQHSKVVFHNAMADMIWLDAYGVRYTVAGDSMLLAYLLDEEQPSSLETLAAVYAHIPPWKRPLWPVRPRDSATWEQLLEYNTDDTYATLLVLQALYREWKTRLEPERTNIMRLYQHLMLPALRPYVEMALEGCPLHEPRLHGAIERERAKEADAVRRLGEIIGGGVRPERVKLTATSSDQTAEYLRRAFGLELPGSAKDDLTPYAERYPVVRIIQEIRGTQKNLGTYLEPWAQFLAEQGDGRLHSVYRLGKVRTGRTSSSTGKGGPLQTAPRDKWVKKLVEVWTRELAERGEDPTIDVINSDFSQIELRVAAWLAPERTMLRIYNESRTADLHIATAMRVLKLTREQVDENQRQISKSLNFGLLYGMQAEHLVAYARTNYHVTMTVPEARAFIRAFFDAYPDLETWHGRAARVDMPRGYTVTPIGRYRRHFSAVTEVINTPVQSTADDLMKLAVIAIWEDLQRYRIPAKIVATIHDSNIILSPRAHTPAVTEIVRTRMERPPTERIGLPFGSIPVPLLADIAVGRSWGTAKKLPRPE